MATRRDAASPILLRLDSESTQAIRLDRPLTIVGSKLHSHLRIVSPAVSGSHAVLLNLGNHVFVRDLMSRTHVYVNDREVAAATQLNYGDVVRFGEMRFRFVDANVVRQSPARARSVTAELHFYGRPDIATIDKPLFVFGRQPGADLVLDSRRVSKSHAVLYMQAGGWMLRDLGSREGTLVNGAPIRTIALTGGEIIRIGRTAFTFVIPSGHQADEETVQPLSVSNDPQAEEPQAEEPNEGHVFVAEPVVVDDGLTREHSEAPVIPPDPVAEFLADRAGGAVKGMDLVESTAPEPAALERPAWGLTTGITAPVDLESVPALPENEHADDPADLLNWGVVQGNVTASTFPPQSQEHEGGAENHNSSSAHVDPIAEPIAALQRAELPVPVDPEPIEPPKPSVPPQTANARAEVLAAVPNAVLSEPVDLEFAASPTSGANEVNEPPNLRDPLGDIVAQEVLTIYVGDNYSPAGTKPRAGRSRAAVFVTVGATLIALAAAAAGGAWFYLHRS